MIRIPARAMRRREPRCPATPGDGTPPWARAMHPAHLPSGRESAAVPLYAELARTPLDPAAESGADRVNAGSAFDRRAPGERNHR